MEYLIDVDVLLMEPDTQNRVSTETHIIEQGRQALIYTDMGPQAFYDGERLIRLNENRKIRDIISNLDSPEVKVSYAKGRRKISICPHDINGVEKAKKSGEKVLKPNEIMVLKGYWGNERNHYVIKNNDDIWSSGEIGNGINLETRKKGFLNFFQKT